MCRELGFRCLTRHFEERLLSSNRGWRSHRQSALGLMYQFFDTTPTGTVKLMRKLAFAQLTAVSNADMLRSRQDDFAPDPLYSHARPPRICRMTPGAKQISHPAQARVCTRRIIPIRPLLPQPNPSPPRPSSPDRFTPDLGSFSARSPHRRLGVVPVGPSTETKYAPVF